MARFLWITDSWRTLDHPNDTTLRLAQEAIKLGHESHWCDVHSIRWQNQRARLNARRILSLSADRLLANFELGNIETTTADYFHSIHYRADPPVDLEYLQPLQILSLDPKFSRFKNKFHNPLHLLLSKNEKLEAASMDLSLMPPTVVSSQIDELAAFGRKEGTTVLKPLHQAQSRGVELLHWRTEEEVAACHALLHEATQKQLRAVLLQRYLPAIHEGETRLWFLGGKMLATVRKLPLHGDFRINIDQGSRLAPHALTQVEKKAVKAIGAHLKRNRITLAAVDLIDGLITDFNFTSPGLIVQMEKTLQRNVARPIIKYLAGK